MARTELKKNALGRLLGRRWMNRAKTRESFLTRCIFVATGVLLLSTSLGARAQSVWAKNYGGSSWDQATCVRQTSDGGYVVVGSTYSFGNQNGDIWIIRLDGDGEIVWQKDILGPEQEYSASVAETPSGDFIIAGTAQARSLAYTKGVVIKLDRSGSIAWQKTYASQDYCELYSVQPTSDGGYIAAGRQGPNPQAKAWIAKLNPSGDIEWNKTFGGAGRETFYSVQQTSDGGYVAAGETNSFGSAYPDMWVVKTDPSGRVVWQNRLGGNNLDRAMSVRQTADGGYVVGGTISSVGLGISSGCVAKLNSKGRALWVKAYGGNSQDTIACVQQTSDSGFIAAGQTGSFGLGAFDFWLLRLDPTGEIVWQKTYGGPNGPHSEGGEYASSVQQTRDGGYVVAGWTDSYGDGVFDDWVLKTDGSGNLNVPCTVTSRPPSTTMSIGLAIPTTCSVTDVETLVSDVAWGCIATPATAMLPCRGMICPEITLSPASLPPGLIGHPYLQQITADGCTTEYRLFDITSGGLPTGVYLSPGGLLTGTPQLAGSYALGVVAVDLNNCNGRETYTLQIDGGTPSVTIRKMSSRSGPFRVVLEGTGFHSDVSVYIGEDESPWGQVNRKGTDALVLKGGAALAVRFPKGQPVPLRVLNGDGSYALATYSR